MNKLINPLKKMVAMLFLVAALPLLAEETVNIEKAAADTATTAANENVPAAISLPEACQEYATLREQVIEKAPALFDLEVLGKTPQARQESLIAHYQSLKGESEQQEFIRECQAAGKQLNMLIQLNRANPDFLKKVGEDYAAEQTNQQHQSSQNQPAEDDVNVPNIVLFDEAPTPLVSNSYIYPADCVAVENLMHEMAVYQPKLKPILEDANYQESLKVARLRYANMDAAARAKEAESCKQRLLENQVMLEKLIQATASGLRSSQ